MKAHQRIIREKQAELDDDLNKKEVSLKEAVVKPVSRDVAKHIIEEYEWLGGLAAVNWFYYGIFFNGVCGGVVVYGPEYIENLGRWDNYGYTNKIILLNRGACVHWAHPHSASKLISHSIKMLPEKYKVVTATVDDLAGEVGTIYQACNFDYIGSMRDNNPNVNSRKGDRDGWLIDGKLYNARSIRAKFGTTQIEKIKEKHPNVKKVKQNSKGRYFFFRGSRKEKRQLRKAIMPFIKPYPKRVEDGQMPLTLQNVVKTNDLRKFFR